MTSDMLLDAGSWLVGSPATEIGDAQLEIAEAAEYSPSIYLLLAKVIVGRVENPPKPVFSKTAGLQA